MKHHNRATCITFTPLTWFLLQPVLVAAEANTH
jgi:hypothetical protein